MNQFAKLLLSFVFFCLDGFSYERVGFEKHVWREYVKLKINTSRIEINFFYCIVFRDSFYFLLLFFFHFIIKLDLKIYDSCLFYVLMLERA